jgi:histidyl-tRNA synthetase
MAKAALPQGTRDFDAITVRKRQYILNTIKTVFELYGFAPLETPAMENLDTLMGKYGDEGDKLIYRILDSGNPFSEEFYKEIFDNGLWDFIGEFQNELNKDKIYHEAFLLKHGIKLPKESFKITNPKVLAYKATELSKSLPKLKMGVSSKALKYDLTIPFARYVAMNHGQLSFPFKRYQMQPVWRADKPQRGRYREFTQCDADVVGSKALLNEVELALIYHEVFTQLKMKNYELRINSRKILAALAELCGGADKMMDITIAIDKLDKIGVDKVKEELQQRGLDEGQIEVIVQYLDITGSNSEKLQKIKLLLDENETGKAGIAEIEFVLTTVLTNCPACNIITDFTLARGLNYYTGIIFEAKAPAEVKMGSIGGGGRYDDLTGLFGVPGVPGVGISFGIDRIYDVLEEMKLFPGNLQVSTRALFFNLGEKESAYAFTIAQMLRSKGIACELYHEQTKMDKQFKYAEKRNIPYVIIIGSRELEQQNCVVKNLGTGVQQTIQPDALAEFLLKEPPKESFYEIY